MIGGRAALRLHPGVLGELARGHAIATVSGTNGKTTTTRLLAAAVACRTPVATNSGGANMAPGIVSALAAASPGAAAVLEVDEIWLPQVAAALSPAAVVLLNLSRDQLDRSNETRRIAALWRRLGSTLPGTVAVANVDDPLVVWAALGFGAQRWVAAGQRWTQDASVCPQCAGLLLRGGGTWHCAGCGLARPEPTVQVLGSDRLLVDGREVAVRLALPGTVNAGNAALALAAATGSFGIDIHEALAAMSEVRVVAGRYAVADIAGRRARLLLAKNPAGWMEMLALLEETPPRPVVIHFHARVADGRDPSWLWDVPLERLAGRPVHVSGERAEDVLVRLAYAGVRAAGHASPQAAARAAAPVGAEIDILATYTAFRELAAAQALL